MHNLAVKIAVIESEAGWGRKIDDWMVCLSIEDAKSFEKELISEGKKKNGGDYSDYGGADEFAVDDVSRYTKLSDIWKSVN